MPYTDKAKEREANKERARRYREAHKPTGPTVTPVTPVTPDNSRSNLDSMVIPSDALKAYISRPSPGMANLERLQRLSGSLGKYGSQVFMGNYTIEEIGKAIGVLPPLYPRS
uniref:Uncharacterized protein n=1 Tax=viral metagenome TaxID=1070528 RepID=A0A6M3JR54_9ZZZZ